MNLRRQQLLIEPPQSAASDIAFILIIFFLVCASVQPDKGHSQSLPQAEEEPEDSQQSENIELSLSTDRPMLNGDAVTWEALPAALARALEGRQQEADRVVLVKSQPETPYERWIFASMAVDQAGGIVTLQLEETQTLIVD